MKSLDRNIIATLRRRIEGLLAEKALLEGRLSTAVDKQILLLNRNIDLTDRLAQAEAEIERLRSAR